RPKSPPEWLPAGFAYHASPFTISTSNLHRVREPFPVCTVVPTMPVDGGTVSLLFSRPRHGAASRSMGRRRPPADRWCALTRRAIVASERACEYRKALRVGGCRG